MEKPKVAGHGTDVPRSCPSRWEANSYAGVGIERLQEIAHALKLEIHETVTYATRR